MSSPNITSENILVLNLGLRSIRAIVFNPKGEKLVHSWYPVQTFIKDNFVEQYPDEWWDLAKKVILEATKDEEIKKNIKYITVTSSAACLVALDKNGNPTCNVIMVSDKRAAKQAQEIKNKFQKTLNSNNLANPSFMMPKILWLKENKPEIFKKTEKFMSANDYLIYKLSGEFITDELNAEKFYYNPEKKSYPQGLLDFLEISKKNLPEIKDIGETIGKLRPALKKELGLTENIKIVLSTYDAICAFWGGGVGKIGDACNVCGTCMSLRVYADKKIESDSGILSQYFKNFDAYIVGGSNNLDGGLLEWAKSCFYGDSYLTDDAHIFEIMEQEAKESSPGAEGLIFLPYLIGERVPFYDSDVRGVFFGMERSHSRKEIIRSIFESTGFMALSIIKAIEKAGTKINNLKMSGGLSQIDLICELRADITGKEVHVIEENETTSLGAFLIAAIANKLVPDLQTFVSSLKIRKTVKPNPENYEKYQSMYNLFESLYRSLRGHFSIRKDIIKKHEIQKGHVINNL